ncbi:hypothetical protein [Mycoplasma leonicaptivi]|uniref:hypothetical protein n=1 Tax=Mycoplasma leonicaptivi TaxID=36742 RepID=UPI00055A07B9|nr:hypothetical protein [Mycoplasma leonicaptivi]
MKFKKIKYLSSILLTSLSCTSIVVSCKKEVQSTPNQSENQNENISNEKDNLKNDQLNNETKDSLDNSQNNVNDQTQQNPDKKDVLDNNGSDNTPKDTSKDNSTNTPINNQNTKDTESSQTNNSTETKQEIVSDFVYPDIIDPKNLALTVQGNIKNPKDIFDREEFPQNVVLEGNSNNIQIVDTYFNTEMDKVYSYLTNTTQLTTTEFPKWFNPYKQDFSTRNTHFRQLKKYELLKQLPDLYVWFKEGEKYTKVVKKNLISYIQDNELKIQDNIFYIEKNIKSLIDSGLKSKTLNVIFPIKYQTQNTQNPTFKTQKISIDISNVIEYPEGTWTNTESNLFEQKISLQNNILKIQLKPSQQAPFNKLSFDDINLNNSIVLSKYGTLFDFSYTTEKNKDKHVNLNNNMQKTNSLFAHLTTNQQMYSLDSKLQHPNGKRITEQNSQGLFDEIRKRVFVVGGGTSTMLGKVKPSDPNSSLYYFITNRHVSDILSSRWTSGQFPNKVIIPDFDDQKVSIPANDISIDVEKSWFEFNFWQSFNQNKRDGSKPNNAQNINDADISINIIDIKPIVDKAKQENNQKILAYFNEWQNLTQLKLSEKTKYLNDGDLVQFYIASFPIDAHSGYSGRRFREHIINRIEEVTLNDQAHEFAKYGRFRSFVMSDDLINGAEYDLISGGSGSLVFDENMNMVALFMQNIPDSSYGFGLLASQDYDYFGYETNNNENSFKKKLEKEIQKNPNKFEMIEL